MKVFHLSFSVKMMPQLQTSTYTNYETKKYMVEKSNITIN